MGAVPKPHEPTEFRPTSDHTRTGLNEASDVGRFRHSLQTMAEISLFLKYLYVMRMGDVESAFPLLPVRYTLWRFLLFVWFDVRARAAPLDMAEYLYCHICGDFGSATMPGTFKFFFKDATLGMARSEMVLSLPVVLHVDDLAIIGAIAAMVDAEGEALDAFLAGLGIYMKELKARRAAAVQLALGFWSDSEQRTRTLDARKLKAYTEMLRAFAARRSLSLRERQQAVGRIQRALYTLPPGAACYLAS